MRTSKRSCMVMGSVISVLKLQFPSEKMAKKASHFIRCYKHAVLGSAIVVPTTLHNFNHIINVMVACDGYTSSEQLTDYDYEQVL